MTPETAVQTSVLAVTRMGHGPQARGYNAGYVCLNGLRLGLVFGG